MKSEEQAPKWNTKKDERTQTENSKLLLQRKCQLSFVENSPIQSRFVMDNETQDKPLRKKGV
jgi:hypothetical protein